MGVFEGGLQSSGKGFGMEGREVACRSASGSFLGKVQEASLYYQVLMPPRPSPAPSPHCTCWPGWAEAGTSSPPQTEGHHEVGGSQGGCRGPGTGLLGSC